MSDEAVYDTESGSECTGPDTDSESSNSGLKCTGMRMPHPMPDVLLKHNNFERYSFQVPNKHLYDELADWQEGFARDHDVHALQACATLCTVLLKM